MNKFPTMASLRAFVLAVVWVTLGVFQAWAAPSLALAPAQLEKVNWESRQLTFVDINSDGLQDMAYINGIERSIDILVQKQAPSLQPSLAREDAPPSSLTRYTRQRIALEAAPQAFVFGRFSGSSQLQLAYTSRQLGVVFLQLSPQGQWVQQARIPDADVLPYTHLMWAGQLKKDDPVSLLVLTKGRLLHIQGFKVVASYHTLREESGHLTLNDINSDGLLDVLYDYEAPYGLAYRLQSAEGRFDAEKLLAYANESEKDFGFRGDRFYFFGGNTSFVESRQLVDSSLQPRTTIYGTGAEAAAACLVPLSLQGQPPSSFCLALADSKGSQLLYYSPTAQGGWGAPQAFPSLKSVTALCSLSAPQPTLALFSPEERAIGLTHWIQGRFSFPSIVDLADEPVALVGHSGLAWALTRQGNDYFLQSLSATGALGPRIPLQGLRRPPDASLILSQQGGFLLGLFHTREVASFYFLSSSGALTPVQVPASLLRANFTHIEPSRLGVIKNEEGFEDLVIAQRSTLRLYRYRQGQLSVADGVLPLHSAASLTLPLFHKGHLWAYDARANLWYQFARDAQSPSRLWQMSAQFSAPSLDPQSVLSDGASLVGVGRRAIYALQPEVPGVALQPLQRFQSQLRFEGYQWASLEDFGPNAPMCAVLFNQKERLLEVVAFDEKGLQAPVSLLNFQVYQADQHFQGRKGEDIEPREIMVGDVTGDSRSDLVLLVHNKILVYPQK